MTNCFIMAREISSQSLCHLIADGSFFAWRLRTLISGPSLVSLQLNGVQGRTPVLQSMPLLATALVELDIDHCHDSCYHSSSGNCGYDRCEGCQCDDSERCVLLRGLSNATDLMLLAEPNVHSPVLEKLAFGLYRVEMEGSQNPESHSHTLKQWKLNIGALKKRVQKLLRSLIFCGVPADVIKI